MSQGLLVLNAGSSSIKFSVFALPADGGELELVCRGFQENIGEENPHFKAFDHDGRVLTDVRPHAAGWGQLSQAGTGPPSAGPNDKPPSPADGLEVYDHQAALRDLLDWLGKMPDLPEIIAAGHRVVHGGEEYSDPQRLTPEIMARLETFVPLAPLHQPHNLAGIRALTAVRPDLPQVGCFDTAFHSRPAGTGTLVRLAVDLP
jgi:acetate kinase